MGHYQMPPKWFGESPIKTNVPLLLDKQANYFTGAMCKIPDNKGWNWTLQRVFGILTTRDARAQ
jgi:hypothetical protein